MRTLKGFEAVEVADRFDVFLYDLERKADVTAYDAREELEHGADPDVFVLENWPDTNEEAEQIVLKEFQRALKEGRLFQARIYDISNDLSGGLPLHLGAAELAAQRLVEKNKLELLEESEGYNVYQIPRSVYFADDFLSKLRGVLCNECAQLNLEGPFHETCLINFIDFIKHHNFSLNDITEEPRGGQKSDRIARTRPTVGMEWLSKTASVTKSTLKRVWKPLFVHDDTDDTADAGPTQPVTQKVTSAGNSPADAPANVVIGQGRTQISKADLIRYLQNVEVLDDGELTRLQTERQHLLSQIAVRDEEIDKAEKRRGFMEQQFKELQRDMDILVQAMHIAKRREEEPPHVVEATIQHEDE